MKLAYRFPLLLDGPIRQVTVLDDAVVERLRALETDE